MSKRTEYRRRRAAGLTRPMRKNYPNEKFFETWTAELAWMIGLIWSDGCLYGNTIEISSKDFQLIDLIMSLTDGHYALKNKGIHLRVHFSSKVIAERLRTIGLMEKKSLTIGWPHMPIEYESDFMRGLIDGDGSILLHKRRTGQQVADLLVQLVTASPYLKDGIKGWFNRQQISYSLSFRNSYNGLWKFSITKQSSLRKLYGLLYPVDDIVCLHRKYAPYNQWIQTPRVRSGRPRYIDAPLHPHTTETRLQKRDEVIAETGQLRLFE
jgi:hypothetical protein